MTAVLTREQKLMAGIIIQLGNIAEAIQSAADSPEPREIIDAPDSIEEVMSNLEIEYS